MIVNPVRAKEIRPGDMITLSRIVAAARDNKKSIGFTNGCFDILHAGHIFLLGHLALTHADFVIVGVNTDEGVRALKGPSRPIFPYAERVNMLTALRFVDVVVGFRDSPYELIATIKPDVLMKGDEYEEDEIIGAELVKANGGCLVRIPMLRDLSTTKLIERIRASDK
jgi:D-beta-D-heptose 7-phosphate kinase/D-beta-D-heptose 1-phosphate adenosyltransferase